MRKNVVLTGFMGSGKSTVGRRLAALLGLKFIDLDHMIEEEAGATVSEIFATKGEGHFRALERGAIRRITSSTGDGVVLATGGGAIVDDGNRAALKSWGTVVCLETSVEEILKRVGAREDRPLLSVPDREAKIRELLEKRRAAYKDCDLKIDTTRMSGAKVAGVIRDFIAKGGKGT